MDIMCFVYVRRIEGIFSGLGNFRVRATSGSPRMFKNIFCLLYSYGYVADWVAGTITVSDRDRCEYLLQICSHASMFGGSKDCGTVT